MATTTDKSGPAAPGSASQDKGEPRGRYLALASLGALGVVYGDIGTSPLYAIRECFHGPHAFAVTEQAVLGALSLIFWSLIIIVSVKYLAVILRADNRGEGGMLALMALLGGPATKRAAPTLVLVGLFGTALLYGDGIITPAISVLAAMEGLNVATTLFEPYVVPGTILLLLGFFFIQRRGTAAVGAVFGPFTLLWFLTIAVLGMRSVLQTPGVFAAVDPRHAAAFFRDHGLPGLYILGTVFLVVTGGEALYADLGHFGSRPIRAAWFAVVLPSLLLNYFGQGALLLRDEGAASNPFYRLAPGWMVIPLVGLATGATIIASQAMVSGAFSLTRQAVQLGFIPRLSISHTSAEERGQIYIAGVNWFMCAAVVVLVLGFRTSSNLAAAYGIAVSSSMVITTVLAYFVARRTWKVPLLVATPVAGAFFTIDVVYFGANAVKIPQGGWFPILVAIGFFTLMTTWKTGRRILAKRLASQSIPLEAFIAGFRSHPPHRVPGTAVFMSGNPEGTPVALMHNLKHNKVLHERVLLLTISTDEERPHVAGSERLTLERLEPESLGFWRLTARYGFMENPSVPEIMGRCAPLGLEIDMMQTTFFLGRETLIPTRRVRGMALWREALFAAMSRNALPATAFFRIPPNRVVELGSQVEI